MKLIEQAQVLVKRADRLLAEENWVQDRDVVVAQSHGRRSTVMVAAIDALNAVWVAEATAKLGSSSIRPIPRGPATS